MTTHKHTRTIARSVAVAALIPIAAVGMYGFTTPVTVLVDDETHETRTTSNTVGEVLDELDINVNTNDLVQPDPAEEINGEPIVIERAIDVTVETSDGDVHDINAPVQTVQAALEEAGFDDIDSDVDDKNALVFPGLQTDVTDGDTILVTFPTEVDVEADGNVATVAIYGRNVSAALRAAQVELTEHDIVSHELTEPVDTLEDVIVVQRVTFETETVTVDLPFEETRQETDDLEQGDTQVDQPGEEGVETQTWTVTYVDGEETEREHTDTETTKEPSERVILVGTRAPAPPPPPPAPEPAPAPAASAPSNSSPPNKPNSAPAASDPIWDRLAQCESNGNWSINTGNGYYGGLQFLPSTWHSVGGTGMPHQNSRAEQIYRAQILQERSGWGQWPACTRKLGLR